MTPASRSSCFGSSCRRIAGALTVLFSSGLCAAGWTPAQAQASLVTVASFNGVNGEGPYAGVTFDSQGNLFGTTYEGGANEVGTVFEIVKGSTTITDFAAFDQSNGDNLEAGVTFDSSGNLFGITAGGGTNTEGRNTEGTVYEIVKGSTTITDIPTSNPDNVVLQPQGGLTLDTQGNLFGTTYGGGAKDKGTVFEIAKGSTHIQTLASFNGTDGENPYGGVTFDRQGNLFGTTAKGGANDKGTVFEIAKGTTRIKTVDFFDASNGSYPQSGVTFDSEGNLFGTTTGGGAQNESDGHGTVFEIAKGSAAITDLVSFNGTDGDSPDAGVTFDSRGNLFGTTTKGGAHSRGMVYEIAKGSTHLKILASFNGANGSDPEAAVAFDSQGNLFGTTAKGGANDKGTVFEIAAPGSSSAAALTPAQASPAKQVSFITVDFFTNANETISNEPGPHAGVTFDSSGNLFGTTHSGGTNEFGTVFKIAKGTTRINTLASFRGTNGGNSDVGMALDRNGNLFGTTQGGGANDAGTVFEIVQGSRHIKTVASFAHGNNPGAGVTLDGNGNLFGTTFNGGVHDDGSVFEIAKGSTRIKTLVFFNRANIFGPAGGARDTGRSPNAGMTFDRSGNLFGTTFEGGTSDDGTVFEIAKGSRYIKTVASFGETIGTYPQGGLTFDGNGNLFGTAYEGGADDDGTVFEIAKGSTAITEIAFFNGADGKSPAGVTFDRQGNLFGITYAGGTDDKGTVYEIAKGSTRIRTLVSFTGANGSTPSGVTFDRKENLFGTTQSGGAEGFGTVFEIAGAGSSAAEKSRR